MRINRCMQSGWQLKLELASANRSCLNVPLPSRNRSLVPQVAYCFHLYMFIVCCDNSHNRCVRIIFVDHFDTHSRHVKSKPNYHNFSMMLFQVIASIYAEITMFQNMQTQTAMHTCTKLHFNIACNVYRLGMPADEKER